MWSRVHTVHVRWVLLTSDTPRPIAKPQRREDLNRVAKQLMGYIDARDLLMEVSQDYSWPQMYSRCSWKPSQTLSRWGVLNGFDTWMFWQFAARKLVEDKTRSRLFFGAGAMCKTRGTCVPKLNGRSSRQPLTMVANMDGEIIWEAAEHRPECHFDIIYVYLVDKHFHVLLPEV